MKKESKIILLTSIIIGIIILLSMIIIFGIGYQNQHLKKQGSLYLVIKQYEVENGKFKVGDKGVVIFESEFTDALYYHNKIETKYGYNEVLIENGVARVIDANCPHPHSLNGCMSSIITNDNNFLDSALICCMQHGISIGWEVRRNED